MGDICRVVGMMNARKIESMGKPDNTSLPCFFEGGILMNAQVSLRLRSLTNFTNNNMLDDVDVDFYVQIDVLEKNSGSKTASTR